MADVYFRESLEVVMNTDKPTNPALPECDGCRRGHSLSPSHGKRTVDGEACIQLHNALHSREVKQSVDIVGAKRQLLDYDLKGWHFQASTSQHTPDASMKQHEEAMLRTTEENNRLKGQLSKMKKENERLQAEKQKLNATSMTTMREAKSEKEHMLKALQETVSNLQESNCELTEDLDVTKKKLDVARKELDVARVELDVAREEVDVAREELDAAREEIDARIQHEMKITRELRASNEDKSRFEKILKELQDQCEALQVQLELNKGDFEQERNDRATAAGRYEEEKEQLLKTIEDLQQNMKNKDDQVSRLSKQLRHSASSSQGLEHELQRQETEYRHLEQQLKREIDQLKQQQTKLNKELTKKTQERTRRSPRHPKGGHSGQDEDTEVRIATLQSMNSHLTKENKRHIRKFQNRETYSRQLEQQLRGEIHKLKQEYSHLVEQKRRERRDLEHQHQVLSQQYHDSQRTVEKLREEIRELNSQQLKPLPSQPGAHIVSRGVGPLYPKAQDIKLSPEYALTNNIVEKDGRPTSLRYDFTNGKSDLGYSSGKQQYHYQQHKQHQQHQHQQHKQHQHQQHQHQQNKQHQPQQHQQHQRQQHKQHKKHHQKEDARQEQVCSPHQSLPVSGNSRVDTIDDFSDLELSASLPPPILGGRQRTLSSESETSFQPNQRYIGDGINREIKQQAKHYKVGVQRGLPVADDVDEKLWPYDPNLDCPHCGKRFRHGQIREFRYHIDDEHPPPSLT